MKDPYIQYDYQCVNIKEYLYHLNLEDKEIKKIVSNSIFKKYNYYNLYNKTNLKEIKHTNSVLFRSNNNKESKNNEINDYSKTMFGFNIFWYL